MTLTYKNLELEHPMIIMHKLIYDGILGIDIPVSYTHLDVYKRQKMITTNTDLTNMTHG